MSTGNQPPVRHGFAGSVETFTCKFGTTQKLNETNLHHWSEDLKAFMRADQTYDVIFNRITPPTADQQPAHTEYRNKINCAFGMIFTSCTQQAKQHIRGLDCPIAMWASLKNKYDITASRIGRSTLQRQFFALRLEPGMTISNLISGMKSLQSRLLGTDMEISPNSFISLLNSCLPEEYLPTIDRVLTESNMTTDQLVEGILQKEQAIWERKDDVRASNTAGASTTVLVPNLSYSNPSRGRTRGYRRGYFGMRGRFQNGNSRGRVNRRQETRHIVATTVLREGTTKTPVIPNNQLNTEEETSTPLFKEISDNPDPAKTWKMKLNKLSWLPMFLRMLSRLSLPINHLGEISGLLTVERRTT